MFNSNQCHKNNFIHESFLVNLRGSGFSGFNHTLNDQRASVPTAILDNDSDKDLKSESGMQTGLAESLEKDQKDNLLSRLLSILLSSAFSNLVLQ